MWRRVRAVALVAVCLGLGSTAAVGSGCSSPEQYLVNWGKQCDPDDFDTDCVDFPGTFCHPATEWCTCQNADGTTPQGAPDQFFCEGACRPIQYCQGTWVDAG